MIYVLEEDVLASGAVSADRHRPTRHRHQNKSLNAFRQMIDEIDSGRFPGLLPAGHHE